MQTFPLFLPEYAPLPCPRDLYPAPMFSCANDLDIPAAIAADIAANIAADRENGDPITSPCGCLIAASLLSRSPSSPVRGDR